MELLGKIERKEALVGVVGLGYVGLPLALAFAEKNIKVLGFDVDVAKAEAINRGSSYIQQIPGGKIKRLTESGLLAATSDFDRLSEPDVLLICVPTPLTKQMTPDMRYVEQTANAIGKKLRSQQLVVLESTTYPGTTDELLREILEKVSGLKCGSDFFLAFSPEREDPGNPDHSVGRIPKVVGGVDPVSTKLTATLYSWVSPKVVRVRNARTAEAVKLLENVFRAVNIALVNELKVVFTKMEIDIWEVLDAAATKPFGFMRFNPGPGWGGHCIPVDPFYLSWKAREYGVETRFIELAGQVNVLMPRFVVERLTLALNSRRKPVAGSKILLLGIAYKKDIDDPRESPAFEIWSQLLELDAEVDYHDPHIPRCPRMRRWPQLPRAESVPLTPENLRRYDAVVIVTDHSSVDWDMVLEHANLIVDSRGVYKGADQDKVVKA